MWLELIFGPLVEWALDAAPKPVRIGCSALFVLLAIALLTIGLWWPR